MGYLIKHVDDNEFPYFNTDHRDQNGVFIHSGWSKDIKFATFFDDRIKAEKFAQDECYYDDAEIVEVKFIPTSFRIDLETIHPQFDIKEIHELKFPTFSDMDEYFYHLNITEVEYIVVEI